jgi:hypothetical protein
VGSLGKVQLETMHATFIDSQHPNKNMIRLCGHCDTAW